MGRAQLNDIDRSLVQLLRQLRQEAGWTIVQLAEAISLPRETLRGVLFRKNRAGMQVLGKIFDFVEGTRDRFAPGEPPVIQDLRLVVIKLLQGFRIELMDDLWRRVRNDFDSEEKLLDFLRAEPQEWNRFAAGEDPSPTMLRAIALAYRGEAQRVQATDPSDARQCKEIAAQAERLLVLG